MTNITFPAFGELFIIEVPPGLMTNGKLQLTCDPIGFTTLRGSSASENPTTVEVDVATANNYDFFFEYRFTSSGDVRAKTFSFRVSGETMFVRDSFEEGWKPKEVSFVA